MTKKATRRSKKKARRYASVNSEPSADELLKAASVAMESLDVERAYQTYCRTALLLQKAENESATQKKDLIHVFEKMGELQVSIGDQDLAKEHFVQSLRLLEEQQQQEESETVETKNTSFYETHSCLCFYIGQLSLETEALDAYQRGINSLEECIQIVEDNMTSQSQNTECSGTIKSQVNDAMRDIDDVESSLQPQQRQQSSSLLLELKQRLSGAYCNLAELYLTDLCEEETAERNCEHYLELALQLKDNDGEPLVDALQTMASLRLSQQERQFEAVSFILQAYEKQRIGSEALATLVGLQKETKTQDNNFTSDDEDQENENGQARELLETEAANNLPDFEFRCQTAKLLLECAGLLKGSRKIGSIRSDQEDECITAAVSVLGSLLAQNDEVIEIWFLTGCAFAAKTPPLTDTAKFYLERAKEMLTDTQKVLEQESQHIGGSEQRDLEEELEMNAAQMHDVQTKLNELLNEMMDEG